MSTNIPNIQPSEDRYQFADNLSWTKGTHQIKFGVDFAWLRDTENALFNGPGSYTYGSITAFAQARRRNELSESEARRTCASG